MNSILELISSNQIAILTMGKELKRLEGKIIWLEENIKANKDVRRD